MDIQQTGAKGKRILTVVCPRCKKIPKSKRLQEVNGLQSPANVDMLLMVKSIFDQVS